jgi:hypothetical protein
MGPRKEHQRRDAGAQRDAYQGGDNDALHLFAVSRQSEVTNLERLSFAPLFRNTP